MPTDTRLNALLSTVPTGARDELLSFLAFSERETAVNPARAGDELLVSLSFFNASTLRVN